MPAIFLEQKIKNGITTYDVIDGKQRLTAIGKFINNEISLPKNFSSDEYGYEKLNGKTFSEIEKLAEKDTIADDFLDTFWSYKISIEYIEKPDDDIVRNIFDRLNRYGVRLNPAELRKSRYGSTYIYNAIQEIAQSNNANALLNLSRDKRQRCINFWTEVFIFTFENKICSGDSEFLDKKMYELSNLRADEVDLIKSVVEKIINLFIIWKIDQKYNISKETHLYVLLYLAQKALDYNIDFTELGKKLNQFYEKLRTEQGDFEDDDMKEYYDSTQSGSKSGKSRKHRFNALVKAIGLTELVE